MKNFWWKVKKALWIQWACMKGLSKTENAVCSRAHNLQSQTMCIKYSTELPPEVWSTGFMMEWQDRQKTETRFRRSAKQELSSWPRPFHLRSKSSFQLHPTSQFKCFALFTLLLFLHKIYLKDFHKSLKRLLFTSHLSSCLICQTKHTPCSSWSLGCAPTRILQTRIFLPDSNQFYMSWDAIR